MNDTLKALYLESHGSGSHGRILDLVERHSRHAIIAVRGSASHWKWSYGAVHFKLARHARQHCGGVPDVLVISGLVDVAGLLALLPADWRSRPKAVYFHESQWTYPNPDDVDNVPFLLGHLTAVACCNEVWFNSRYHLATFHEAALAHPSRRLRQLARSTLAHNAGKFRIVYPPVEVSSNKHANRNGRPPALLWSARWERDKRPDLFIATLERLAAEGIEFELVLLGQPSAPPLPDALEARVRQRGPLADRREYERALADSDIFVSTADHEFFGVAAIEAAMAEVQPVVPRALAYPETLPSARFYAAGELDQLVTALERALQRPWGDIRPWRSDAARFAPAIAVAEFDAACERLAGRS